MRAEEPQTHREQLSALPLVVCGGIAHMQICLIKMNQTETNIVPINV